MQLLLLSDRRSKNTNKSCSQTSGFMKPKCLSVLIKVVQCFMLSLYLANMQFSPLVAAKEKEQINNLAAVKTSIQV